MDEGLADSVAILFQSTLAPFDLVGRATPDAAPNGLDPRSLSYRTASALPVSEEAKQELLEVRDTAARLRRIAEALMALSRIGAAAGAA